MKVLFKNTTKFSKEMYTNFLEFHNKTYHLSYFFSTAIVLLLLLYCLSMQILYKNYLLVLIFLLLALCFLGWRLFHPLKTAKAEYASDKIKKESEITYLFFPTYYIVRYQDSNHTMRYYKLRRIFETDTFFYLYIDKSHAFLIDKSSFSLRNFRRFLFFPSEKSTYEI